MKADADPSTALGITDFGLRGAVKRERRRPESGGAGARTKTTALGRNRRAVFQTRRSFLGTAALPLSG